MPIVVGNEYTRNWLTQDIQKIYKQSDQFVVAKKYMKVYGAKGLANNRFFRETLTAYKEGK